MDLVLEIRASTVAVGRPDNKQNCCKLGKNKELRFRKGSPLVCGVMGIACSSYVMDVGPGLDHLPVQGMSVCQLRVSCGTWYCACTILKLSCFFLHTYTLQV